VASRPSASASTSRSPAWMGGGPEAMRRKSSGSGLRLSTNLSYGALLPGAPGRRASSSATAFGNTTRQRSSNEGRYPRASR
jgi:hypothetical protein